MKKYTILFLLFFISCNYIFREQQKSANSRLGSYLWIVLTTCYVGTPKVKSVSYIDNMDGSVTANMLYDMDRPNCVVLPKTEVRSVLIKKCMQGQVYQKDQNNCRGKGSEADGWGAEKYQYCPTNDRACEKYTGVKLSGYTADETKSPAAIACAQETFLGKKWNLPEGYEIFTEGEINLFDIFADMPGEGINLLTLIHMTYASSERDSWSIAFYQVQKNVSAGSGPKNNFKRLLCISK